GVKRIGGLHVVVVVEQDGRAGRVAHYAVNIGRAAGSVKFGPEALRFEQFAYQCCCFSDAPAFSRQAGNVHQPGGSPNHVIEDVLRNLHPYLSSKPWMRISSSPRGCQSASWADTPYESTGL